MQISTKNRKVSVRQLLDFAQDLKSEDGENPEYDRALCELICEAAGFSMSLATTVAKEIGMKVRA